MRVLTDSNGRRLAVCFCCIPVERPVVLKGIVSNWELSGDSGQPWSGAFPHTTSAFYRRRGLYKRPSKRTRHVMRFHAPNPHAEPIKGGSEEPRVTSRPIVTSNKRTATHHGDVTRLEVGRSSPVSHRRSRRMIAAQADDQGDRDKTLPKPLYTPKERGAGTDDGVHSSRCSMPSFETFASVISSGIQSGELSGAVSSQAHPSYL